MPCLLVRPAGLLDPNASRHSSPFGSPPPHQRKFGEGYGDPLLAKSLHDVYAWIPDESYTALSKDMHSTEFRFEAAHVLATKLLQRNMPRKLLQSIEEEASDLAGGKTACVPY